MSHLEQLVRQIYDIVSYELSSNCHKESHIEYILYRLQGGTETEDDWFINSCNRNGKRAYKVAITYENIKGKEKVETFEIIADSEKDAKVEAVHKFDKLRIISIKVVDL